MDYFILWTVSKLIKQKVPQLRIVIGALLGALLYCMIIFIPGLHKVYNILGVVALPMIPVAVTYRPNSLKEFIKLMILLHVTAFAVGGAGIALFYYTNISHVIGNMISYNIQNFPLKVLIASTSVSYIIIKLGWGWIRRKVVKQQTFYSIKIHLNNEDIETNALVDTGNSLYDPITKAPVIVVEFSILKSFLPDSIRLLYYEHKENDLNTVMELISCSSIANRMRMIPFTSLGTPNGLLIGFKPDYVEIMDATAEHRILKDVIVGIYNYQLSKDNTYQALLHPDALQHFA